MQLRRIIAHWRPELWRYLRRMMRRQRRTRRRVGRVATALALATCALLGGASGPAATAAEYAGWHFEGALLYYDEGDRVTDSSLNFDASRAFRSGRRLSLHLSVDALTGASASGAVPASGVQTFTSPSGDASYTTPAGATPLDSTFLDTRIALSGSWTQPLGKRAAVDFGLSASNEYDYMHTGANVRFRRDFNERNTSLTAGIAFAFDSVDPVGGAPIPLAEMLPSGQSGNKAGSESKDVGDLLIGVTQVFGPRTIGQINYAFSRSSGYLNDPYKLLSVVDPTTGDPIAGPGSLFLYLFENRPDSRTKHSLFSQIKRRLGDDVLDASYRFMTDDWGVDSHTVDLRYRHGFGRYYVQPHLRYYIQSAAEFYRGVLLDGESLPAFASADYRLSELTGLTYGLKLGRALGKDREWSVRLEYYDQSSQTPAETQVGALRQLFVDPTVDALIVQTGFRF